MDFKPNKRFKKDYDKLFKEDPLQANLLLLLCELANENGEVIFDNSGNHIDEMIDLIECRFNDPAEYAL